MFTQQNQLRSDGQLYNIPSTGLRFFTVYGPAGRPDMAYFGFTNKLVKGETIKIFNYGNCKRDFTYVDICAGGGKKSVYKSKKSRGYSFLCRTVCQNPYQHKVSDIGI